MIRIIVPAYNEAKNLGRVCEAVAANVPETYQLYIVNDGSKDDTAAVATDLANKYPIRLLTHPQNKGVAEAFRTGFTAALKDSADTDFIFVMEGDATSDARLVPKMIAKMKNGADVVVASRYLPGGGYKDFPLKRLILSKGANIVFRVLFPMPGITDYSIFYRGYRVPPLKAAWEHYGSEMITADTFFSNCEILLKLRPYLKKVDEVPMLYDYGQKRGKSGMKIGKNLRSYLKFILNEIFSRRKL